MAGLTGYQQWLTKIQPHYNFLNNYWCAMLAYDMDEKQNSENFKIPYFIVEEELTKEDWNMNFKNKDDVYISNILKHWLIHLLNDNNEKANELNYEEALRSFLEKENVLPVGIARPLTQNTSFHNLPTECKLWIFYTLRTHNKLKSSPRTITKDQLGNLYFIVPDCRLYVNIARSEIVTFPIDEEVLKSKPWGSLYRYTLTDKPCKLLCQNRDTWESVWRALLNFKLNNLYYAINSDMMEKLSGLNYVLLIKDEQRINFEELLNKPINETVAEITPIAALPKEIENISLNDTVSPSAEVVHDTQWKRQAPRRCWNFPQCPLNHKCPNFHPTKPCLNFPNCIYGWKCSFLHEQCPNDGYCEEPNCIYEHWRSLTTYNRLTKDFDAGNARQIASVYPLVRNVSDKSINANNEVNSQSNKLDRSPRERTRRCQYFPQCPNGNACKFIHPSKMCNNFANGRLCPGQWCIYLHGTCHNDDDCSDPHCVFEHYKSKPVLKRKQAIDLNGSRSLSRVTSMSNMSRCSGQSRGRKSPTFGYDSDDESIDSKESFAKSSADYRPVGILRAPDENREKCPYGQGCGNKYCEKAHSSELCLKFPECPSGGGCFNLHPVCKMDVHCSRDECEFRHTILPRAMRSTWCKRGSGCTWPGCKFIHPKECIGRCPSPGNCWMYHRPISRPIPGPAPIFGLGSAGPGFQGPHRHGLSMPPGQPMGYCWPAPAFPPGHPGFVAPSMLPTYMWPGGYGTNNGYPVPNRPNTPVHHNPSPPPSYVELSTEDRSFLERKRQQQY